MPDGYPFGPQGGAEGVDRDLVECLWDICECQREAAVRGYARLESRGHGLQARDGGEFRGKEGRSLFLGRGLVLHTSEPGSKDGGLKLAQP